MAAIVAPPPKLTVSEWADRYRRLSAESSAEPGQWRTERAPYLREMMDAITDPDVTDVAIQAASQVGKTEIILNAIGFFIDQDPSPMLLILPTLELAESWSKDRLATMIRDNPRLKEKVADSKTKDSGNTLLHKTFPGGHITLAGANSPASLSSRPIRVVLFDEVDRYPASAGGEGDPVSLARKRSSTFFNRKAVLVSSPTLKGTSRIEAAFEVSDKRLFFVPCPHCDTPFVMRFTHIRWPAGEPGRAAYFCEHCGAEITDGHKPDMLRRGKWQATAKSPRVGFHISAIYSPWVTFAEIATEYEQAKSRPDLLKVFVNTFLGEPWEETVDAVDFGSLLYRREDYIGVPEGALVLTAGVDVQDDRLEVEIVGFGRDEESWGIARRVLWGDPGQDDVWQSLDDLLAKKWDTDSRLPLQVSCTCIDSGGHHTRRVYAYCRGRAGRRIFPIKGFAGSGRALVGAPNRKRSGQERRGVVLYPVGVDEAKTLLYSRLKITEPGSGYCHFPKSETAGYNEDYFRQLTSERVVTRYQNGFPQRVWTLTDGRRNEALDCRVYAMSALVILNPLFDAIEKRASVRKKVACEAKTVIEEIKINSAALPAEKKKEPTLSPFERAWERERRHRRHAVWGTL